MTRHLVIDTDTASDDAVALLMAVADPDVEVDAVTVVAGNVPLDLAVKNALFTLGFCGAGDVPVHRGLERPLVRPLGTATAVHGEDGMGDTGLVRAIGEPVAEHAVDALIRLANEAPGQRDLVTLGPLTNVAVALVRDRQLLTKYRRTFMMAGSPDGVGNVTATAEFNVWADPEAASIVLSAPGELTLVGWNISRTQAVMGPAEQQRLMSLGTARANFVQEVNARVAEYCRTVTGLDGYDLPDPVTMAIALHPDLVVRSEKLPVGVALGDELRGQLIIDHRLPAQSGRGTEVVWEINEQGWKELLFAACSGD
jgi:purine nucleosidase